MLANYVLPENPQYEIITHKYGENYQVFPEQESLEKICDFDIYKNLHLKLLKFERGYLQCVKDQPIDAERNALFEFSPNGQFLSIYLSETRIL